MRIATSYNEKGESRRWLFNWGVLLFSVGFFFVLFLSSESSFENGTIRLERTGRERVFPLEKIGWGPLSLGGMRSLGPVPNLARELILIGRNNRPDAKKDSALLLGLKSTAQEKLVASGDLVYLKRQNEGTFLFSDKQTDLAIRPLGLEGEGALVEVMLAGSDGPQRGEITLGCAAQGGLEEEPYWKSMKAAQSWGPDLFLQKFGGSEYPSLLFKHKLKAGEQVFFVSEGDLLTWGSQGWAVSLETPLEEPIARIASITPRGIQIQIWDPTGFHSETLTLPVHHAPRQPIKADELMTKVKARSKAEISCLLGKKRAVIKEGDWWVKTATGWKSLKTVADIEDFVHHRLQGELFIFDQIELDKGKIVVRGHHFDAMRTQMQPLNLNLTSAEKNSMALARRMAKASQGSPLTVKGDESSRIQIPQLPSSEGGAP